MCLDSYTGTEKIPSQPLYPEHKSEVDPGLVAFLFAMTETTQEGFPLAQGSRCFFGP